MPRLGKSKRRDENDLTARQRAFINEYVKDWNGTQAAIRAGYSAKTASVAASELLSFAKIRNKIDEIKANLQQDSMITAERVIRELASIGLANMADYVAWRGLTTVVGEDPDGEPITRTFNEVALKDSDKLTREQTAAISEVSQAKDGSIKFKTHNKVAALDKLGQHLGLWKQITELSGPNGAPLPVAQLPPISVNLVVKKDDDT